MPSRFSFHQLVKRTRIWLLILVLLTALTAMFYLVTGASQSQETVAINMDERIGLPPVRQMGDTDHESQQQVLRVAIAGVISPTMTLEYYQELLHYMGRELGM